MNLESLILEILGTVGKVLPLHLSPSSLFASCLSIKKPFNLQDGNLRILCELFIDSRKNNQLHCGSDPLLL